MRLIRTFAFPLVFSAAASLAIAFSPMDASIPEDVDSESYSEDGSVVLQLGDVRYVFAPEVAAAVGEDLVLSARELMAE